MDKPKPSHTSRDKKHKDELAPESIGVSSSDASAARLSSDAASRKTLVSELEAARQLVAEGRSTEAEARLHEIIKAARGDVVLLAQARCALALALDLRGRYREALAAVEQYETTEERAGLDSSIVASLWVQIGRANVFTGNPAKAIALLKQALDQSIDQESDEQMGAVHVVLAQAYREINEHPTSRDYAQKALEHFRRIGARGRMAEAYLQTALADNWEGDADAAIVNYEQALKLVGDHPSPSSLIGDRTATYLLGTIYGNMSAAYAFIGRPKDCIHYLEKAISFFERTEHKERAAIAFTNLGHNLIVVGDWQRAQEVLDKALALVPEGEGGVWTAHAAMILDSLGNLQMLRGNLNEAQALIAQAVALARKSGKNHYIWQALHTLSRYYLATVNTARAEEYAQEAIRAAERISDHEAICELRLLLAEVHLARGEADKAAAQLQQADGVIAAKIDAETNFALQGETSQVHGLLALARKDAAAAIQHFGRSLSIYEMLGYKYRAAVTRYELGCAYALTAQTARAAEHLKRAVRDFSELGAIPKLTQAKEALATLERESPETRAPEPSLHLQLILRRLTEAISSRPLLLRELAAVISQETDARQIAIFEMNEEGQYQTIAAHNCTTEEAARLATELRDMKDDGEKGNLQHNVFISLLPAPTAPPVVLYVAPRASVAFADDAPLDLALRVVKLGLEVCALRERTRDIGEGQVQTTLADQSLLPGFIYSSPAMKRLVEEVHKIRSSNVTVLITGESGTGKELVARLVHALSSRRAKAFVPFNCTAVPKELTEAYLFGYRRGAFTGATSDSPGVIRAAADGTLFLDEVGDLALDVQPKILRFLQEGEIQPLGEQRPTKVDVRIVAATNTQLEEMVAQGRFREDLYYRLNVIRLRVPALRERRSEIPTIVNYYVNHYAEKFGRRDIGIAAPAMDLLMVADWPGNVRQLTNEIQRIVARSEDGTVITPDHLSEELRRTAVPVAPASSETSGASAAATTSVVIDPAMQGLTLAEAREQFERHLITEVLRKHGGKVARAARELGLTRRGLYLKLEHFKLEHHD